MEEGVDKERNEAMGRRRMERREQQMRARLLMMLGAVGRGDGGLMVATIGGMGGGRLKGEGGLVTGELGGSGRFVVGGLSGEPSV